MQVLCDLRTFLLIFNCQTPGHYYISFGSDRIEMKNYRSVIWEKDGIRYMITGFDTGLSANDLFKMAQSILK